MLLNGLTPLGVQSTSMTRPHTPQRRSRAATNVNSTRLDNAIDSLHSTIISPVCSNVWGLSCCLFGDGVTDRRNLAIFDYILYAIWKQDALLTFVCGSSIPSPQARSVLINFKPLPLSHNYGNFSSSTHVMKSHRHVGVHWLVWHHTGADSNILLWRSDFFFNLDVTCIQWC